MSTVAPPPISSMSRRCRGASEEQRVLVGVAADQHVDVRAGTVGQPVDGPRRGRICHRRPVRTPSGRGGSRPTPPGPEWLAMPAPSPLGGDQFVDRNGRARPSTVGSHAEMPGEHRGDLRCRVGLEHVMARAALRDGPAEQPLAAGMRQQGRRRSSRRRTRRRSSRGPGRRRTPRCCPAPTRARRSGRAGRRLAGAPSMGRKPSAPSR